MYLKEKNLVRSYLSTAEDILVNFVVDSVGMLLVISVVDVVDNPF